MYISCVIAVRHENTGMDLMEQLGQAAPRLPTESMYRKLIGELFDKLNPIMEPWLRLDRGGIPEMSGILNTPTRQPQSPMQATEETTDQGANVSSGAGASAAGASGAGAAAAEVIEIQDNNPKTSPAAPSGAMEEKTQGGVPPKACPQKPPAALTPGPGKQAEDRSGTERDRSGIGVLLALKRDSIAVGAQSAENASAGGGASGSSAVPAARAQEYLEAASKAKAPAAQKVSSKDHMKKEKDAERGSEFTQHMIARAERGELPGKHAKAFLGDRYDRQKHARSRTPSGNTRGKEKSLRRQND